MTTKSSHCTRTHTSAANNIKPVMRLFRDRWQELVDVLHLMEPALQCLVLVSQVHAGMWRRNGLALQNQVGVNLATLPRASGNWGILLLVLVILSLSCCSLSLHMIRICSFVYLLTFFHCVFAYNLLEIFFSSSCHLHRYRNETF